jgi:hypothetical protein
VAEGLRGIPQSLEANFVFLPQIIILLASSSALFYFSSTIVFDPRPPEILTESVNK